MPLPPRALVRVRALATARPWLVAAALFVVLFAVYALTVRHDGGSFDTFSADYAAWHLVHTGHPWLDGSTVPGLEGDPLASVWVSVAANGHTVVTRFPGVIALSLPAYWIAGPERMTVLPASLTAAAVTALGITLLYSALRRTVRQSHALVACGVLALATPLWSVAADDVWPHTVTVLALGGMAWASATRRWWLVGLFGGVGLWGRLHAAVIVAVLGLLLGWTRRSPRITLVIGTGSGTLLGLLSLWTHWWVGSWNPVDSIGGTAFIDQWDLDGWPGRLESVSMLLVSPDRGILVWTPVVALLLPALVRGWREVPDWARGLALGGVAYSLAQTMVFDASGGDSFYGYRYGLELLVAATPALVVTAPRMGRIARVLVVPVVALQVCAFAFGAVTDMFLTMDDVWTDNTFVHDMGATWPYGPLLLAPVFSLCLLAGYRLAPVLARPSTLGPTSAPRPDLSPVGAPA